MILTSYSMHMRSWLGEYFQICINFIFQATDTSGLENSDKFEYIRGCTTFISISIFEWCSCSRIVIY